MSPTTPFILRTIGLSAKVEARVACSSKSKKQSLM
jgi:hypothetical protein